MNVNVNLRHQKESCRDYQLIFIFFIQAEYEYTLWSICISQEEEGRKIEFSLIESRREVGIGKPLISILSSNPGVQIHN